MKTFKKYNSLINEYKTDEISSWILYNPDIVNEKFIITEKLDGSNFLIEIDSNGNIFYGKRTSYININSDFYGFQKSLEENKIVLFIEDMVKYCKNTNNSFTFYGELFGSNIQNRVFYGKDKKIRFYDIFDNNNNTYINASLAFDIFCKYDVNVPIIATNVSWDEAINWNNKFISTLTPEDYKNKENNICEGIVIKPLNKVYMYDDKYFIIKSKNELFNEKNKEKSKKIDKDFIKELEKENYSNDLITLILSAKDYVNENRLNNVISHYGPLNDFKQISEYMRYFMEDYQNDFLKDNEKTFENLTFSYTTSDIKKIKKIMFKESNNECLKLIKSHITNKY